MDSYNLVNGAHSSENEYLLNEMLKKEWGFQGMVMSDWGGVHSALGAVMRGNDLEMPTGCECQPAAAFTPLMNPGPIPMSVIDDHVRRILRVGLRLGLLDGPKKRLPDSIVCGPEHLKMMREGGGEGHRAAEENDKACCPLNRSEGEEHRGDRAAGAQHAGHHRRQRAG